MKLLSRNLTSKEKVLVAFLAIALLGLVYYRFVYSRVNTALISATAEAQSLQTELDAANTRIAQAQKMKEELSGVGSTGLLAKMGSYNSSKPETAFLNTVLSNVSDYTVTFDDVTRDGDQIRRNFSLQYTVPSYAAAESVMKDLTSGEYRCLVSDVGCEVGDNGVTTVKLSGTFYETMVGGTPDSALPEDQAETADPVTLEDFE